MMNREKAKQWADALNEIAYQRGASIVALEALCAEADELLMAGYMGAELDKNAEEWHKRWLAYRKDREKSSPE